MAAAEESAAPVEDQPGIHPRRHEECGGGPARTGRSTTESLGQKHIHFCVGSNIISEQNFVKSLVYLTS